MDENARPDEESSRAMLPLLQLPSNQHSHRITNFYIDDILRPDFGRKRKARTLVRDGDSLGEIICREELRGKRSSTTGIPQQGGAGGEEKEQKDTGASSKPYSDSEASGPERAGAGEVALKEREEREEREAGGDQYLSSQASPASESKPMLWPAWVYCTRYSDRPSSGWWESFLH